MGPSLSPTDVDELLRHPDWVRALARRLVADAADRDDLVQETWLAALGKRPQGVIDARGWLGRMTRNLFLRRLRSASRRTVRERAAAQP